MSGLGKRSAGALLWGAVGFLACDPHPAFWPRFPVGVHSLCALAEQPLWPGASEAVGKLEHGLQSVT